MTCVGWDVLWEVLIFLGPSAPLERVLCLFTGLVVMGQPVDSNDEDEDTEGVSASDDDEEEAGGDTNTGRGGEKGSADGEAVAEDSASLVHPVVKVTFDLMRKLRELPISGGSFEASDLFFLLLACSFRAGTLFWTAMWCGLLAATVT